MDIRASWLLRNAVSIRIILETFNHYNPVQLVANSTTGDSN
jgi:hypothetical protein